MDQVLFYILIAIMLGLLGVVLMFVYAYVKLHTQLMTLTKQNMYLKNDESGRAEEILHDAHKRALIIIDGANQKATSVLTEAHQIDDTTSRTMQTQLANAAHLHSEELKKASADLLTVYKKALDEIRSEDIQNATNITKNVNKIAEEQIGQFKDILAKETINSEKLVEGKVTKEYEAMEGELQAYKDTRLKEIDNEILQIIQSVTEAVLKKQLTGSDQEQLVYDALTKMKETQARM